jgi:hypothetical protein
MLQSCQFWGALSDERSGLSFVSQSLEVGHLSVYEYTYKQNIYKLSDMVPRSRIFIRLPPAVARWRAMQWGRLSL